MADSNQTMEIGEVAEIVQQMLADDKARINRYAKIDDAVGCKFKPDTAVSLLPFIQGRSFALTDIADARNAGTRVFTSLLPNIEVSPVTDNEGEYDRVDKMEQAWKWEMEKMNRPVNNVKGIHDQIVESAVTYHSVAFQTEYLPYKFKDRKKDARVKAILARKCFQWTLHHPGTVHSKYSDYGLERVAKVSDFNALQLAENFGAENEGVVKLLEQARTTKKSELMRMNYTLVDLTDWKYRVQYAFPSNEGGGVISADKRIVFMNELHGLPFINWVIVDYGDPLWQSILESGHWSNLQHMKLIKFSKAIALAAKPDFALTTSDGTLRGVWLDWKNPLNPMILPPGTQLQELQPNKLDPQFEAEYQEDRSDVARSTVARILQDPTPFLNSPFSTFNASITTALGQLSPAKRTAETAEAEAIYQNYQWIKHSGIPFNAYRAKTTDSKMEDGAAYQRGGQIVISPKDPPTEEEFNRMGEEEQAVQEKTVYFNLDSLYINVQLQSANMTDEQARLNVYLNARDKADMSSQELWERMGWDGYTMNLIQSGTEALFKAELQAQIMKKDIAMREQIRNEVMQEVQAQQAADAKEQEKSLQNTTNEQNAGSQFAGMQGADLRGGGMAAAQGAPNENRVSIRGQTDNGGQTV